MKKALTSTWFWLMMICFVGVGRLITILYRYGYLPSLLTSEIFWVAISSVITFISVLVAVFNYIHSEDVRQKQATYDAYNEFKNSVFETENQIIKFNVEKILQDKKLSDKNNYYQTPKEWNVIKLYLTQVERIATCVNNDIFDAKTIYNMGGPFMINMYRHLEDIIKYKRTQEGSDGIYEEFEKMVHSLKKAR